MPRQKTHRMRRQLSSLVMYPVDESYAKTVEQLSATANSVQADGGSDGNQLGATAEQIRLTTVKSIV